MKLQKNVVKSLVQAYSNYFLPITTKVIHNSSQYQKSLALIRTTLNYNISLDDYAHFLPKALFFTICKYILSKNENPSQLGFLNFLDAQHHIVKLLLQPVKKQPLLLNTLPMLLTNVNLVLQKVKHHGKSSLLSHYIYYYLYEDLIKTENKKQKLARGEFYTPISLVNFLVRSVFHFLTSLVSRKPAPCFCFVDLAMGSGVFLNAVQTIFSSFNPALKNPCFIGFEPVLESFFLAVLNLGDSHRSNRFPSLFHFSTPLAPDSLILPPKTCKNPFYIVLGNPPFNTSIFPPHVVDTPLITRYKQKLTEKKICWNANELFIAKAHQLIQDNGQGMIALVTNNSFLETITKRGMRRALVEDFDEIYILNLHGNKLRKEKDENVFKVGVGISVVFFVKTRSKSFNTAMVKYFSILTSCSGKRTAKLKWLETMDIHSISWEPLEVSPPNFLFIPPLPLSIPSTAWPLPKIFPFYRSGIKTDRDYFFIRRDKTELLSQLTDILSTGLTSKIVTKYKIRDSSSYPMTKQLQKWRERLLLQIGHSSSSHLASSLINQRIYPILYRPLDIRYIYYDPQLISRSSYSLSQHFLETTTMNFAVVTVRQFAESQFSHVFVTNCLSEVRTVYSSWGNSYLFPLFLFSNNNNKQVNFSQDFLAFINSTYSNINEEQVFGYIYALLFSSHYRKTYQEAFRRTFPFILFHSSEKILLKLSALGWRLIHLHLFLQPPKTEFKGEWFGTNYRVEKVVYLNTKGLLHINQTSGFKHVSKAVYSMNLGGHIVLPKLLNSYRSLTLLTRDIKKIEQVIGILKETLVIQKEIDSVLQANPFEETLVG